MRVQGKLAGSERDALRLATSCDCSEGAQLSALPWVLSTWVLSTPSGRQRAAFQPNYWDATCIARVGARLCILEGSGVLTL